MSEQYTPNLGQTPDETARRDAVHIAVAPVVVGEDLKPGDRVGFKGDNCTMVYSERECNLWSSGNVVGVVDPFLRKPVSKGQRCWLFLFPGTITSLRHVWSHPAFSTHPGGQP